MNGNPGKMGEVQVKGGNDNKQVRLNGNIQSDH